MDALRRQVGPVVARYLDRYSERLAHARLDEKLIRDPIFGFLRLRPYEALIVDSPLFQRLRGIFQTALTFLTYPSAIHTRFEHSLNCLNLASRVLQALEDKNQHVGPVETAEVRLAALVHDIGHCIFSHGSEFFYRHFPELTSVVDDTEVVNGSPSESECVNFAILTSVEFASQLWEPIKKRCLQDKECRAKYQFLDQINLHHIAQMIIGMAPGNLPANRYLSEIINGPLDVDKLDYLTRDGYFTGVNLSVDIDRLLPSLDVAKVANLETRADEWRLVVDHRGVAVVEQLLFARMLLYDTVYHHHKVRAAQGALTALLETHYEDEVWPTTSKRLNSIADFLEIDEYDFYGRAYSSAKLQDDINRLRYRNLPARALVITGRSLVDAKANTIWTNQCSEFASREEPKSRKKALAFFDRIRKAIISYAGQEGCVDLTLADVIIDIPDPPGFKKLGVDTLIKIHEDSVEPLGTFFPFDKVVNNYSKQYKYRTYVFAPEARKHQVAYAAFRAFREHGIVLNDLSLILAHQESGVARDLLMKNQIPIPDWRSACYIPDLEEAQVSASGI